MKMTGLILLWCVLMGIMWGVIILEAIERALMHAL
jgi:hypothetical protein